MRHKSRTILRIALALLLVTAAGLFFALDLQHDLTLSSLKERRDELIALAEQRPVLMIVAFFLFYVGVTALSLPGATVMTMAAGAIFGFRVGLLIASFASSIGASLAFLTSRYLLRDWARAKSGSRLEAIDRGVATNGNLYLLSLRLVPFLPYFLVNIAMGLTSMRLVPFYLVSQVAMLPGTALYVNAGVQLSLISSVRDIFSPAVVISFLALAAFPVAAKYALARVRRRQVYKAYRKPRRFDRNLVVIGAGAGGLVSAYLASVFRAKVTLIEAKEMGGDCLNTGCVPSKALIRCARAAHQTRTSGHLGISATDVRVDFRQVMEWGRSAIREIAPADSEERYTGLGVDVRRGFAKLIDPWTVEIGGSDGKPSRLTTRSIIIAAGGEPAVPNIPGLGDAGYLTSESMWEELSRRGTIPDRLVILGGGPIGTEMAQAFARLGSRVTLVEGLPRILSKEDEDVSSLVEEVLRSEGVEILTGHKARRCEGKTLVVEASGIESNISFDDIIVAVGRKARLKGYGLEELGIATDRTIGTNEWLETNYPNIYAVGDVAGPYQFTHFAAHQAGYAVLNSLFGSFKRFRTDYSALPWTTFTDPEVAHVGHNETSAREAGLAHDVVRYDLAHLDRAVTDGQNRGFVKILTRPGKDRIIGATVVAAEAAEITAELVLAMKHRIGLRKVLSTIHSYPTMAEANRYAAGEWRKQHRPERLLRLAERYHRWRRR